MSITQSDASQHDAHVVTAIIALVERLAELHRVADRVANGGNRRLANALRREAQDDYHRLAAIDSVSANVWTELHEGHNIDKRFAAAALEPLIAAHGAAGSTWALIKAQRVLNGAPI